MYVGLSERAIPFHVKRDLGAYRGDARDRGEAKPEGQRIGNIVVIKDIEPFHLQRSLCLVEVNFNGGVWHADHPEHIVGVNVHVEVVNLIHQSDRTGVHVKSNEGEGTLVLPAVNADKSALTETHVGLEVQGLSSAGGWVRPGAGATNVRQAHEAVEVRYLRWIIDAGESHCGIEWIVVNEDGEGRKRRHATWNGFSQSTLSMSVAGIGVSQLRAQQAGAQCGARARHCPQEHSPRGGMGVGLFHIASL